MIHNIITSIAAKTNQYIKNKLSIDEDIVIVRSLVDIKGNLSQGIENKIVVFLLSIEEEKLSQTLPLEGLSIILRLISISTLCLHLISQM